MAQEIINIGTAPNDGSGDSVRTSFNKVNKNFTELYGLKDTAKKLTNGPFVVQLTSDGSLILPANGSIKNTASAGFRIIAQTNATGQTSVSANMVDVILNDPVQSAAIKDSPTNFEIIFNGGFTATITGAVGKATANSKWTLIGAWPANPTGAPLVIRAKNYVEGTAGIRVATNGKNWTFGNDGKLKLPLNGDIVDSAGNSVLGLGTNSGIIDFDFGYFVNTFTNPVSYFLGVVGIDFGVAVASIDLGTILSPSSLSLNFGTDAPTVDIGDIVLPNSQIIDFGTFAPSVDLGSITKPSSRALNFEFIKFPSTQSIDLGAVSQFVSQPIDLGSIIQTTARPIDFGPFIQVNDLSIDFGTF